MGLPDYASDGYTRNSVCSNVWSGSNDPCGNWDAFGQGTALRGPSNEEGMRLDLDLFEHRREEAAIRMAKYKGQVTRYYNAMVRHLSFKPGDLVLRKNSVS